MTMAAVGVFMWVLNLMTPEMHDDFWYKFVYFSGEMGDLDTTFPVTSLRDIAVSEYNHYFGINGRIVVHAIVQLFTAILGKPVFNVFNAAMFVAFAYLLTRLTMKVTVLNLLFSCAAIVLLYPAFGDTMLWMTGSVNYLWTSAGICLFLLFLNRYKAEPFRAICLLPIIPCFILGWTHEGLTMPLAASLGLYALVHIKSIFRSAVFPSIVAFGIGALFCSFTPATLHRVEASGDILDLGSRLLAGFILFRQIKVLYCLAAAFVVIRFTNKTGWRRQIADFYKENIIVFNAMLLSLGIVFLAGYNYTRLSAVTGLYGIILLLTVLRSDTKRIIILKSAACMLGVVFSCVITHYVYRIHEETERSISRIENSDSNIIPYKRVRVPHFIAFNDQNPILINSFKPEKYMSAIYKRENLTFISEIIYDDIKSGNSRINDIGLQGEYPYYVIPLTPETEEATPVFVLNPVDMEALPFYIRPFAPHLARYTANELPCFNYGVLDILGSKYMFVSKHELVDYRLREIALR